MAWLILPEVLAAFPLPVSHLKELKEVYSLSPWASPLKTHCSVLSFSLAEFHHSFYITLSEALSQGALLAVEAPLLLQELFE